MGDDEISNLLGDGSPGQDVTNLGLGPSFFGYPSGTDPTQFAPNPVSFGPTSGFDINAILNGNIDPSGGSTVNGANLGVPSDDSSSSSFARFLNSIGLGGSGGGSGGGGGIDISRLIAAALGIGSGVMSHNATQHATDQAVAALQSANTQATNILNGTNAAYRPYADLGNQAAGRLMAMPADQSIAGNFNPLGSGRGIKLGTLAGH